MKLNIRAFALTSGLLWGLWLFLVAWWIIIIEGTSPEPVFLERIYRGYSITPAGSFIGLVWGFIDGVIGGAIFAWLYNIIAAKS